MQKRLLIVVDYQVDFVADDGVLTAGKPAQALEGFIDRRAEEYLANGWNVAFTQDTHCRESFSRHPESAAFPFHCEKGRPGWEIFGEPARHIGKPRVETIEKSAYCPAFSVVERWVASYDIIELVGVATDICVLHTAVGLYTAKVEGLSDVGLIVREEGCASFNPAGHAFAIEHMRTTLGMQM